MSKKEKMRVYIGFDDTDVLNSDFGTGKLARRFEQLIPEGCNVWGVVRQQLLVDPAIPYTSHNSSACVVIDCPDKSFIAVLKSAAITHIEAASLPGSDPGLCLVGEGDPTMPKLESFGLLCTSKIVSQQNAIQAVGQAHLSGHGEGAGLVRQRVGLFQPRSGPGPADDSERPVILPGCRVRVRADPKTPGLFVFAIQENNNG